MNEEEELLCVYLGIDYKVALERYKTDPVMKPLLNLCIRQTKRVLDLQKFNLSKIDLVDIA